MVFTGFFNEFVPIGALISFMLLYFTYFVQKVLFLFQFALINYFKVARNTSSALNKENFKILEFYVALLPIAKIYYVARFYKKFDP